METGTDGLRLLSPNVRRGWRAPAVTVTLAVATIAACALPGLSAARPTTRRAETSSLPTLQAHTGKAFVPTLGDWEGTVNGFPASFQLRYDTALPQRPGRPEYGLTHIVALRPAACPASSVRYSEAVVDGLIPSQLGTWASLGLSGFGFGGGFTGRRSATLSSHFSLKSCSGQLNWNMHPASRRVVNAGAWNVKFNSGATGKLTVLAGGRLATAFALPAALTACNGLEGAVDAFIAANGTAKISNSVLNLTMQFSRRTATGQLNSGGSGCPNGPIKFTATQGSSGISGSSGGSAS
jgi:hypothetical protein